MRCHYEVLKVPRNAGDDVLKKSYRQLALQLHPDKNPNNQEEAKEKFQEVRGAYEILSDPQERAFYDRNRESILRGGPDSSEGPKTNDINLFQYFNTSCYKGFDDSPKGFYTVFCEVFDLIMTKDLAYIENSNTANIPSFGNSETNLDNVGVFYGYWQSYRTSLSFSWVEVYNMRQAHNRYAEKCIEKENKKVRDEAKREFNEEVRSLVEYVRKRDKRWQARKEMLVTRVKENREKQSEMYDKKREQRAKRMEEVQEEQSENLKEYEKHLKAMESRFAEEFGISSDESSEGDEDVDDILLQDLYCIACDKLCKTDKSFLNHEQSRKHKDKAALRKHMREEEGILSEEDSLSEESLKEEVVINKKKKKKKNQPKLPVDEDVGRRKLSNKKRQEFVFTVPKNNDDNDDTDDTDDNDKLVENTCVEDASKSSQSDHSVSDINEENDTEAICENVDDGVYVVQPELVSEEASVSKRKKEAKELGPKSKKKAKQNKISQIKNEKAAASATSAKCQVCQKEFTSRSKLFSHIKAEGHAALKGSEPLVSKSTKKKR